MVQIFNSKLRGAKKAAKLRVKETRKLLRRAKGNISKETQAEIVSASDAVKSALKQDKQAPINKAADRLGVLLNKHLDSYRKPAWRESMESIGVAVLVALLLRSFVIEAFKIPSGSMIPTLAIGDQIFVNKYIYGIRIPFTSTRLVDFSVPDRGSVIVFIRPDPPHEDYIKRVVGRPGDEIAVRRGVLQINGEPTLRRDLGRGTFWDRDSETDRWRSFDAFQYEEVLDDNHFTVLHDVNPVHRAPDFGPVIVPEGHVFVMGDNRDHSFDSRAWGPVPLSNVLGRSMFVWWSWGQDGLDTDRLGTWID